MMLGRFGGTLVRVSIPLLMILPAIAGELGAAGIISFSPTPAIVDPYDTIIVDVWVDQDVDSIHCFRVFVDSVGDGIVLDTIRPGSLATGGNTFFFYKDTLGGYDIFACFLGPGTFTNGPGSLARMTFVSGGDPCGVPLGYSYVLIQDTQLDSLPVSHLDGEFVAPGCCACPCSADPQCDGAPDIVDVGLTINVAFRGEAALVDPSCPYQRTDVDCSGSCDIVDVSKMINVAFRGANAMTEFCVTCP